MSKKWSDYLELIKKVHNLKESSLNGIEVVFPKWEEIKEEYFLDQDWAFMGCSWLTSNGRDRDLYRYISRFLNRRIVITVRNGFVEHVSEY